MGNKKKTQQWYWRIAKLYAIIYAHKGKQEYHLFYWEAFTPIVT